MLSVLDLLSAQKRNSTMRAELRWDGLFYHFLISCPAGRGRQADIGMVLLSPRGLLSSSRGEGCTFVYI